MPARHGDLLLGRPPLVIYIIAMSPNSTCFVLLRLPLLTDPNTYSIPSTLITVSFLERSDVPAQHIAMADKVSLAVICFHSSAVINSPRC